MTDVMETVEPALDSFLLRHGLRQPEESGRWTPLTGGVSSDIWRVDFADRTICVKRALAKLKVAVDWQVDTSRNAYEWAWICFAREHAPSAVPLPLAHDEEAGLFAMEFLDPAAHPVWKQQLMDGEASVQTAASVGDLLARLHGASAHDPALAHAFDTQANFHALRLEPYLLTAAARHPSVAPQLRALVEQTAATRIALVHGDVSPKNILVGPKGPVLLDAECAWFGDPAFDLAFCLNHLLLKCVVQPQLRSSYIACFTAMTTAYMAKVTWEPAAELEARAARLLPGLLLARVDGKSPVEYLPDEQTRDLLRSFSMGLLLQPPSQLSEVAQQSQTIFPKANSR